MDERTEVNFDLRGQTISAAAERLRELAARMDYHAVASGPRTYQLVRRRRQGMRKRTEAMTLTFIEDRAGPRVCVIGDVDTLLMEHLIGRSAADSTGPVTDVVATETSLLPAFRAPVVEYDLPPVASRSVRPPLETVDGLISAVPGVVSTPRAWPAPTLSVDVPSPDGAALAAPSSTTTELSAMTVKRDRGCAPPLPGGPIAITVGNNTTVFNFAVVVGRNPTATVGPPNAEVLAVDDPSLSKSHCVLVRVGDRLVVTDMHSKNGTQIQLPVGQSTHAQPLIPGNPSRPVELPVVVLAGNTPLTVERADGIDTQNPGAERGGDR